jgi:rhamnulokinase
VIRNSKMSEPRHLAVDLGSGSGRVVAGRIRDRRLELQIVSRFRTPLLEDARSGYQCWDIDAILGEITTSLERCAEDGPIASVGIDSWGSDYVLLDANLQRVGEAVCYRDKRTTGMMEHVWARLPAAEIYRRTGIQLQPFNTLYQLAATVVQKPQWVEHARHLLMIPDYLHFKLSGVISNEYTNATTTQMCGVDGCWDPALVEAAGLKRCLMQPPVAAATILGETRAGTGRVKVIAPATHDTASAVAGAPLEDASEAYISSGTWSLMGVESLVLITSAEALRMNFTNEGGLERRFRILKNIMGMWLVQRICEEHQVANVSNLIVEASALPAWQLLINPNDPVFRNPLSMTEAIRAYSRQMQQPKPRTPAQFARCIFDSLALAYKCVKEDLEILLQRKLRRIRVIGGGCQNQLLNQLCADACELPVVAGPVEASALGNLIAQMIALKVIENLEAARQLIRSSFQMQEFLPGASVPVEAYRRFQQLLSTHYQSDAASVRSRI